MRNLLTILTLVILCGCNETRRVPADQLNAYVLDVENGLRKTITKGDVVVEMLYRPKDFIIYQNLDSLSPAAWDAAEQTVKELDYFVLRISREGKEVEGFFASDPARYTQVVNYFAGNIEQDIVMEVDGMSIPLESSVYAPTFGSSGASSVLLAFRSDLSDKSGACSIIFADTMLGLGRMEFEFDIRDIRRSPRLQL